MSDWFTLQTFVAFLIGVMLSTLVKSKLSSAKSAVGA
jgi:hypothetical protein